MSNRDLYKQAFSHLHTDHTLDLEGVKMKMQKKENMTGLRCTRRLLVTTLILVMILAMAGISYAATDGAVLEGLESLKVWINGQPAGEGQISENEDGSFSIHVQEGDKIDMQGDGWSSSAEIGAMNGKISGKVTRDESGIEEEMSIEIEELTPKAYEPVPGWTPLPEDSAEDGTEDAEGNAQSE